MMTVYQGETGGTLAFSISSSVPAISGYVDIVSPARATYRFDGTVVSGYLSVTRSGISSLSPQRGYAIFPQVTDALGRVYFLTPNDLEIVNVPDEDTILYDNGTNLAQRVAAIEASGMGSHNHDGTYTTVSGVNVLLADYLPLEDFVFSGLSNRPTTLSGYGITDYPRELGYAAITADLSTSSDTAVDAAGLSITITVGSRPIMVEFYTPELYNSVAAKRSIVEIYDNTDAAIVQLAIVTNTVTGGASASCFLAARLAPAAGSRTYKIRYRRGDASGTTTMRAAATNPSYIRAYEIAT